jgi:hypothetical protein
MMTKVEDPHKLTTTPVSVFLTREQRQEIAERALASERTVSAEIRLAVKHHLETEPKASA